MEKFPPRMWDPPQKKRNGKMENPQIIEIPNKGLPKTWRPPPPLPQWGTPSLGPSNNVEIAIMGPLNVGNTPKNGGKTNKNWLGPRPYKKHRNPPK